MKVFKKSKIVKCILFIVLVLMYVKIFRSLTGTACVISGVTGFPCPGCGMTRAWISFIKGDFLKAFKYNPLFLLTLLIVVTYLVAYVKEIRLKSLNKIVFTIIGLFLIVYIIRMVLYFPNVEPMTYNKNALLPRIIELFNK